MRRSTAIASGLAAAVGLALVGLCWSGSAAQTRRQTTDADLRRLFARPESVPQPADNVWTPAKVELGRRLFQDTRLSANGAIACATCHDMRLGLADGVAKSASGATGVVLRRHAPSLWNLAWAPELTWDGRAGSLEAQARIPLTHPDEMASSPELAAERVAADPDYRAQFALAFPDAGGVTSENLLKALAAYERTLVSPPTRFDRWIAREQNALTDGELRGLHLFAGKAQCINCHTGFAFTDRAFHDVGLAGDDLGRGPIIGVARANHAFKTPGLREAVWTAPYMHDGSIATLEDVVRHYERGGIRRSTRSREMPAPFRLTSSERADLVAFLETLSSARVPAPSTETWLHLAPPAEARAIVTTTTVSQRDRMFMPGNIRLARGQTLTILNDDTRTHNVRIADPRLSFNSGAQEPGERTTLTFDTPGTFGVHCGIHPTMRLTVDVE